MKCQYHRGGPAGKFTECNRPSSSQAMILRRPCRSTTFHRRPGASAHRLSVGNPSAVVQRCTRPASSERARRPASPSHGAAPAAHHSDDRRRESSAGHRLRAPSTSRRNSPSPVPSQSEPSAPSQIARGSTSSAVRESPPRRLPVREQTFHAGKIDRAIGHFQHCLQEGDSFNSGSLTTCASRSRLPRDNPPGFISGDPELAGRIFHQSIDLSPESVANRIRCHLRTAPADADRRARVPTAYDPVPADTRASGRAHRFGHGVEAARAKDVAA